MTEIPGFVPLASYDDRDDDSGHSAAWKALREASMSGDIDGFQHGSSKRWFVNKAQADRFVDAMRQPARRERREPTRSPRSHEIDVLVSIKDTLDEILALLKERDLVLDAPSPRWPDDSELPG